MDKSAIANYYEGCEKDYRLFWDLDHSLAMHAGYWDETTRTLREALARENAILAELAQIGPDDHVLDAGCGVGGSSLFLAETRGCRVTGITLSSHQKMRAEQHAKERNLPQATFHVHDFCSTPFPSEHFTVVWGLESVCHAEEKERFCQEAWRLLKPGGRLVVADAFLPETTPSLKEAHWLKQWLDGFSVTSLDSRSQFQSHLEKAGFKEITYRDITPHILPSSRRLFWLSSALYPLFKVAEWCGLRTERQTANMRAAHFQYRTLKRGLWQYGIFSATKN